LLWSAVSRKTDPMSRTVHCIKLDKDAEGLPRPPIPGALGQRIFESVSKEAWQGWLAHQTRLINEYRLVLADAQARKFLSEEMEKYFFGGGELTGTHYVPPKP
jgi:Fe-S cluster biosynthesis and repair protein YggX